jgi:hypothetical protein
MLQFKQVKVNLEGHQRTINYLESEKQKQHDKNVLNQYNYKHLIDIDLENVVRSIMANENGERKINVPTENIPETGVTLIPYSIEYNDENRPIKDIMTDFVTDVILNNEQSLFNFIYVITSLFQDTLAIYKRIQGLRENDIFFILKGGNVLRFVAKNFLFDISGGTADILLNYYKKYFKRSDADFSIIINPNLENYDMIFNDITLLSYVVLKITQSIFEKDKTRFFEWYKYNDQIKQQLLKEVFNLLEKLDMSGNKTWENAEFKNVIFENIPANSTKINEEYINPSDVAVRFKERYNPELDTLLWVIDNTNNETYVSYNEALTFVNDRLIKFNLVRMKYGFTVNYIDKSTNSIKNVSVGGELIDVSIGHKDDVSVRKFYKELHNNISLFKLTLLNDVTIEFRSYSLTYLFKDIYRILFVDITYPWDDIKYAKRLNRLFYIGYIDLFTKFTDNKNRVEYLELLKEIINSIERILRDKEQNKTTTINTNLKRDIRKIKQHIEEGSLLYDIFLNKILELLLENDNNSLKSSPTSSKTPRSDPREELAPYNVDDYTSPIDNGLDNDKITKLKTNSLYENKIVFIDTCTANIDILLMSFKNIDIYCHRYPFNERILYEKQIN